VETVRVRYALISDIHSNLLALQAVLEDIDGQGADLMVCAGDLIGYGPYPNEVVREIKKRGAICISGNHERALVEMDPEGMNPLAAAAIWWTAKHIGAEELEFLRGLRPHSSLNLSGIPTGLFHGSPWNDDDYIYEEDANAQLLEMGRCELLISGHTHVPYKVVIPEGALVNPGSVGQPRDGDPRASYIMYDERAGTFDIRRIEYDARATSDAIVKAGLPYYLGQRLLSGI
jgi:putative phosphoesterase